METNVEARPLFLSPRLCVPPNLRWEHIASRRQRLGGCEGGWVGYREDLEGRP